MGRRKSTEVVVISWRDIPAQVTALDGEERAQRILPLRFQKAIDRAAMIAGRTTAQEYVAEWRRVSHPLVGPAATAAESLAARLDAEYPNERLHSLIENAGWEPDPAPGAPQ